MKPFLVDLSIYGSHVGSHCCTKAKVKLTVNETKYPFVSRLLPHKVPILLEKWEEPVHCTFDDLLNDTVLLLTRRNKDQNSRIGGNVLSVQQFCQISALNENQAMCHQ